jgi:predicted aldo/keto reductase-like oxidoreductase
MAANQREFERRNFLRSGIAAAGAAALGGNAQAADQQPASARVIQSDLAIPHRVFGRTGHKLPILGFGAAPITIIFARMYGVDLQHIDRRVELVRYAYDKGLRYFDTARVYGESESIIGKAIQGVRDNIYLATKCHTTRVEEVRKSVEASLKNLQTSYLDAVQIHSPAIERLGFEGSMKIQAELVKLRDEKMIRNIGLTTHVAFEDVLKMIQTDGFDQVLLAYGYFRRGMDSILSNGKIEARDECLAAAHDRKMGIVAMKVLGANIMNHNSPKVVADFDEKQRLQLAPAAIRWTMQDDRIGILNIGAAMKSDVDANIATLTGDTRFTHSDRQLLARFSRQAYQSEFVKKMKVT